MKSVTLLIIPLLFFMTSCSIDWNNKKNEVVSSETELENRTVDSNSGITDFGSGFSLSQTNDETTLSYGGKVVKTWSHTPPERVPFVGDEACVDFFEAMNMLSVEERKRNPNWKQATWNAFDEMNKRNCMREYLGRNIRTEGVNDRFFEIIQTKYDTNTTWIYDIQSENLQEMPTMGTLRIMESASGITVFINMTYGDDNMELFYNSDFSKLISKKEIPK